MAEPTIATGFAEAFLQFAVSRGANRQTLIEQSGLPPAHLSERDNRLPLTTYLALLKAGIKLCNEPALALLFGAEVSLSDISIVGLVSQAATAEEGWERDDPEVLAEQMARLRIGSNLCRKLARFG